MGKPAPFKMVVGHSFFVDETGEKMSKSKGNIIAPDEIYDEYGADVLRMWFTYADFRQKMFASEKIHHQVADAYKKIRFTVRFMLQNCSDFDPETHAVAYENMAEVDRWALARLQQLIQNMTDAFDNWDLHSFYHQMHSFCATDLSQVYLNVCKDRLYTDLPDAQDRRSAQTALWTILQALVRMMAPVLTYTSEEIWQHLRERSASLKESVQLADWPEIDRQADDPDLLQRWERFLQVRHEAMAALEEAKESGECGNPLEARLTIYADERTRELLESFDDLRGLMIVSTVELRPLSEAPEKVEEGFVITAEKNRGEKCERCWMRLETVGDDPQHEGLCDRCARRVKKLQELQR